LHSYLSVSYLKYVLFVQHMVTTMFLPSRIWLGIPVWFSYWTLFSVISSRPRKLVKWLSIGWITSVKILPG
jgi:hypothetical protein